MKKINWKRSLFVGIILMLITGLTQQSLAKAQLNTQNLLYLPVVYRIDPPAWMGPYGGSIITLAFAPINPSIVYAGTGSGGIFRSVDGGKNWLEVNNGLGNLFIDSLAVQPNNSDIVYAGTHGSGVYRSTDGGKFWRPVNQGIAANTIVYTLAVNPGNPNLVYAGSRIQGTYYHGVLYKSNNSGESWSRVLEFDDDWVYSLAVNPNAPHTVAAAVHTRGPYISNDYGNAGSWNPSSTPSGLSDYLEGRWKKGRAVAFDPSPGSELLYYGAWHDGFFSVSASGGNSDWEMSSGTGNAHIYPNGISINRSNPSNAYFAAHINGTAPGGGDLPGGVWRSDDAGLSWRSTGLMGKYMYSVASLGGETVLAGTYTEGLYRSTNGGASWVQSSNGILNSLVTGMVWRDANTVYASTKTGGGVWKSTDGGASWSVFNAGLGDSMINGLVQHPADPNILYALTSKMGLRRIDLRSGEWGQAAAASLDEVDGSLLSMEAFSSQTPADSPDFIDSDGEALQMVALNAVSKPVLALSFARSDTKKAYMGVEGGGVYASRDGGVSWEAVGLPGITVRDIVVDPSNANVVYAATSNTGSNGAVRKSIEGGYLWTILPLPDASLNVYAVITWALDPGVLYAGTSNGVYRYDGKVWAQVGLIGRQVLSIAAHPGSQSRLYAATDQSGYVASGPFQPWTSLASELQSETIQSLNFNPVDPRHIYVGTTHHGTLRVPIRP